tara:strand:+ start:132 stop:1382 length:1251 start_codon:yes stop_codon:yes gene_type:complete
MNLFYNSFFIFCVAFFLRVIASIFFGDKVLDHEFDVLVRNMINGHGYTYWTVLESGDITNQFVDNGAYYIPSAYMPILYPLCLTLLTYIFGYGDIHVFMVLLIQSLIGVVNCFMIRDIYNLKFPNNTSKIITWIPALFPLHIFMSSQISASTLYVFLISAVILFYYKLIYEKTFKNAVILGSLLGFLTLARADAILLIPAITMMLFLLHKSVEYKKIITIVLLSIIIISPMSIRNYNHFGFFYPLTVSGGLNLWLGNNPDATGSRLNYVVPSKPIPKSILDKIEQVEKNNNYESNVDNIYKEFAIDFIKENPLSTIQLSLKKVIFFWVHIFDKRIQYPQLNNFLYWGPWVGLLPFFLLSIREILSNWRKHDIEIFLITYFTFVYSVFFILPRYRLIVLPIYIIFSFYYLSQNKFKN